VRPERGDPGGEVQSERDAGHDRDPALGTAEARPLDVATRRDEGWRQDEGGESEPPRRGLPAAGRWRDGSAAQPTTSPPRRPASRAAALYGRARRQYTWRLCASAFSWLCCSRAGHFPLLAQAPPSNLYLPIDSWATPYVEHLIRAGRAAGTRSPHAAAQARGCGAGGGGRGHDGSPGADPKQPAPAGLGVGGTARHGAVEAGGEASRRRGRRTQAAGP